MSEEYVYVFREEDEQLLKNYTEGRIMRIMNPRGEAEADDAVIKELFEMVYQWGRMRIVVDDTAPAFRRQVGLLKKLNDKPDDYMCGFVEGYRSGLINATKSWKDGLKNVVGNLAERGLIKFTPPTPPPMPTPPRKRSGRKK